MDNAMIDEDVLRLARMMVTPMGGDESAAVTIAAHLEAAISRRVDDRLQSLGGRLLAEHGEGAERENLTLATLGGYLTGSVG